MLTSRFDCCRRCGDLVLATQRASALYRAAHAFAHVQIIGPSLRSCLLPLPQAKRTSRQIVMMGESFDRKFTQQLASGGNWK